MSNKRLNVKQVVDWYIDFDGPVVRLINKLWELEKEYPGCNITTWRDDDPQFWYERLENDEEYKKRILKETEEELKQKQYDLNLLAKLKAKYEEN